MSSVGSGGSRATTNNGTMFLRLKPASERALDPSQIIQELRQKFAHIPGIRAYIQNPRSEEHTSELQSLMRISYAVSCLKKQKMQEPKSEIQVKLHIQSAT